MERVKVLLVDDNSMVTEALTSCMGEKDDVEIVGTAPNGAEALEVLQTQEVDVLVLDLIMPQMDGFGVMMEMQKMSFAKRPRIVVLTALERSDFIQQAMNLGADYYMLKPFDPDNVYAHIMETVNVHRSGETAQESTRLTPAASCTLDERIANIFLSMGIPAHIKGYHYLREAIKIVVDRRESINAITKDLYPAVALIFGTTSSKVERAIRHAIDVAWTRGQIENINMLFGSRLYIKHDKPTNGELIALIADRLAIEKSA